MRIYSLFILVLLLSNTNAQPVRVGTIDVYGNESISTDTILSRIGISTGDTISQKHLAERVIEKRLEAIAGVRLAKTATVCCDNNKRYALFIGVAENYSSIFALRNSPGLKIKLPDSYNYAYSAFMKRQNDAILLGQSDDDWSNGHSMIKYAPARRIQQRYLRWANSDFAYLQKILHFSVYQRQRATAVQIIAYNDDKRRVIQELLYALRDESDEVRNNAIKALSAISYYITLHPGRLNVSFQPFIRMINSVVWADRNKGLSVLMQLSETRNKELFRQLRESSLRSLKQMAQWNSEAHAMPAYVILARMAGQTDEQILEVSARGNFAQEAGKIVDALN